jgi:hypothetical protein
MVNMPKRKAVQNKEMEGTANVILRSVKMIGLEGKSGIIQF